MKVFCEGNISFEGREFVNEDGCVEVPDNFPRDYMEAHGLSTDPKAETKAKRGRPAKSDVNEEGEE